jgi:hypothetical protein
LPTLAVVLVEHVYFFELTSPQQIPLLTFEMNLAIPRHCSCPPAAIRGSHPEVGEPTAAYLARAEAMFSASSTISPSGPRM